MNGLFLWGALAHLVADWFLQNEWMALNKVKPLHPAGWVHAAIHAAALALVFPISIALALGLVHWFIDLRFALAAWRRFFHQTTEGPMAAHVAIWQDQVAHIACVAIAAGVAA